MRVWYRGIIVPRIARIGIGLLLILSGVIPSSGLVSAAEPPPTSLPGHVLTSLPVMTHLSSVAPGHALTLTVALRPSSPTGLKSAVERARSARQGSGSFLSPQVVGQAYGQPSTTIGALASYFASYGLTVAPPQPDHLSFQVTGSAAQIERALSVSLDNYQDRRGRQFYATSNDPRLPANLASAVQAIFGLDNYAVMRPLRTAAAGSPGSYTPADMQAAYNVTPLYRLGYTGAGQTIAILGCDTFKLADVRAFESTYGLPRAPITTVNVDGGGSGTDVEATLDLEWSSAIATGASLRYHSTPGDNFGCTFQGMYDGLARDVSDNRASVLSISLGACEAYYSDPTSIQAFENEFAAAAAEGQSVMVASGDSGAYGCTVDWTNPILGLAYPGSSAYVTSVGGTSLHINGDGSYGSESAWGSETECGSPCGGGGGVSQFIAKPSWQNGVNSSAYREVPDVSLNADPATGNVVYYTGPSCQSPCGLSYGWGGTSIAAPQWAGIIAIANQAAGPGRSLGLVNPLLYGCGILRAQSSGNPPYHDVTSGNNLYYNAAPGWDMATGWGSPNASNLVSILVPASQPPASAPGRFKVFLPLVFNNSSPCAP